MRRWMLGLAVGVSLGAALATDARGQDAKLFGELEMQTIKGTPFTLPKEFGRLVNVVADSEVHYLYFEDRSGNLRIVLIGTRSAVTRARATLQLLTQDVAVIKREKPAEKPE